jgi:hypothetical protein
LVAPDFFERAGGLTTGAEIIVIKRAAGFAGKMLLKAQSSNEARPLRAQRLSHCREVMVDRCPNKPLTGQAWFPGIGAQDVEEFIAVLEP